MTASEMKSNIVEMLEDSIKSKHYNNYYFASETGISFATIHRFLGEEGNPRLSTLLNICEKLNLELKIEKNG